MNTAEILTCLNHLLGNLQIQCATAMTHTADLDLRRILATAGDELSHCQMAVLEYQIKKGLARHQPCSADQIQSVIKL